MNLNLDSAPLSINSDGLVYQHFPREPRDSFVLRVGGTLVERLKCDSIHVFRTSHVAFFLALHRSAASGYAARIQSLAERWQAHLVHEQVPST